MAFNWAISRQKMELNTPPPSNGQAPIEGGTITRHDTDTDQIAYCYYVLIHAGIGASGQYTETWRVQNNARTAAVSPEYALGLTVRPSRTDIVLLPPTGASTQTAQDIEIGATPDPSDAQILATVRSGDDFVSTSVSSRFRVVSRAAYNDGVPVVTEAEF